MPEENTDDLDLAREKLKESIKWNQVEFGMSLLLMNLCMALIYGSNLKVSLLEGKLERIDELKKGQKK